MALEVESGRFTVGVFQDLAWAERGVDALLKQGLGRESSIDSRQGVTRPRGVHRAFEGRRRRWSVHDLGPVARTWAARRGAAGSRSGPRESRDRGTMRRVGFQAHDGRIFHVLTGRGGVMVAIHSEPRAADASGGAPFLWRRECGHRRLDRTGLKKFSDSVLVLPRREPLWRFHSCNLRRRQGRSAK